MGFTQKSSVLVGWGQLQKTSEIYEAEQLPNDYETLLYAAPERWDAKHTLQSELYSLGLCLYFILTGKHLIEVLWQEYVSAEVIAEHPKPNFWQIAWIQQNLALPKSQDLGREWQALVRWLLNPVAEQRPTLQQLQQWLEDDSVIESVVLPKLVMQKVPEAWDDKTLQTVLADTHKLSAIYANALDALRTGDSQLAFNLFENGVFKKHSDSEVELGKLYELGQPVSQSFALAATMYYQAFCKGNPYGAYHLAHLLEAGQGLPKNLKHAEILYRFAAVRGVICAQAALGKLYLSLNQHEQARYWLVSSAQNGDLTALQTLSDWLQQSLPKTTNASEQTSQSSDKDLLTQESEVDGSDPKGKQRLPAGEVTDTSLQDGEQSIPQAATLTQLVNPQKVLDLAAGLEAKMKRLIDQEP